MAVNEKRQVSLSAKLQAVFARLECNNEKEFNEDMATNLQAMAIEYEQMRDGHRAKREGKSMNEHIRRMNEGILQSQQQEIQEIVRLFQQNSGSGITTEEATFIYNYRSMKLWSNNDGRKMRGVVKTKR